MNDLTLRTGTDITHPRPSYWDARYQAINVASSSARNIAATIDYIREKKLGEPKVYYDYLSAYEMRVLSHAMNEGQGRHHGLAYLEQDILHAENLAEKMVDLKNRAGDHENSVAREVELIQKNAHALKEFFDLYKTDIEAERESPEYRLGKSIVEKTMSDMKSASHGIWKAEFVTVNNEATGKGQDLETPASASLSNIANLVRSQRLKLDLR